MSILQKKILLLSICLSFLFYGCSQSNELVINGRTHENYVQTSDTITFRTDKRVYKKGESVQLVITNNSSKAISFGQRFLLQTYENNKWYTLSLDSISFTLEELGLRSGGTFEQSIDIFKSLPKGKYRLVKQIQMDSKSGHIVSEEFQIN